MKRLANKVVFITGGSRGIGAAITRRMAAEGAKVVFTYQHSKELSLRMQQELRSSGSDALAVQADSSDPNAIREAVSTAVTHFGGLNILINNAGIYIGKDFREHTLADYEEIMAVNVRAVYVASLEASKYLKEGGRIITIGSNMADNSFGPQTTLYTMSKSALKGFTRGLARDLGPSGITVNLIQPGPVDTDMNPAESTLADELRSRMATGQYGSGEDIAALVAFLSSDESKYMTGTSLTMDGGLNA